MIKPLIISQNYLIENAPGGQVERAFFERGKEFGYDYTLVASDYKPIAESVLDTYTVHQSKMIQYMAALVRRVLIPDLANLPDYEYYAWGKRALKECRKLLKTGQYDFIHSLNYPCCCHTMALRLKQEFGLPWIAQFYDPWYDSPYRVFKTNYFKEIDLKNERKIAEAADVIIHTNDVIANIWEERYGAEVAKKIKVFPIPISQPDELRIGKHKQGELVISHIGNFMLNRTSIPFVNALHKLISETPQYRKKVKVNFIGNVTYKEKELIAEYKLNDVINLLGRKSEKECFEYYENSDMFLAIDGINQLNIFFPSKILKYLLYQKPILGITPKDSVLDIELKKSRNISFEASQVEKIANYIKKAVDDYEKVCNNDMGYYKRFLVNNIYKEYDVITNSLLEGRN